MPVTSCSTSRPDRAGRHGSKSPSICEVTLAASPTADLGVSGDLGWIWNTFTVKDKSGATVDTGKYLTLLARRDGRWVIIRDIWNSDSPPTPPARAASAQ